ncbi:phage recombination protein Bet [Paenarthrobacter sp. R1]|uniref:phage recombination protein Bet n=1 Tax=Paenarthrobacter sp. R1 TaxID=3049085 RepID=UPI0025558198|nr:phage recombination protein Bet [Paenarthrobacter sp. R1]WIV32190.1 phage recombination protein Bet [Paenarthrobacter sp. R1]
MSTLAIRHQSTALTIQDGQSEFTQPQVAVLRHLGVENATREDLAVFFHQAVRTGLDPFARQIYMIGRWTKQGVKQTIQTGIDGYRLIARRAADRRNEQFGYEDTLWCGEDGQWRDVWLSKSAPAAAKVTVLRGGERFSAVALFSEYAGTNKDGSYTQMWSSKGAIMIAKCAEALALRKAFPQDLSGIYTAEEMAQADNQHPAPAPAPEPAPEPKPKQTRSRKPVTPIEAPTDLPAPADDEPAEIVDEPAVELITEPQSKMMFALLAQNGFTDDGTSAQKDYIESIIGRQLVSRRDITKAEATRIIDLLNDATPDAA